MNRYIKLLSLIFVSTILIAETKVTILSSSEDRLVIQLTCDLETPEDLAPIDLLIGFPNTALPQISIQTEQTSNHFFNDIRFHKTEWIHQQKVNDLNTGTLRISPQSGEKDYHTILTITIHLNGRGNRKSRITPNQQNLLSPKIANWTIAKNWIKPRKHSLAKIQKLPDGHWIQMILRKDGIYKISGEELLKHISSSILKSFNEPGISIKVFLIHRMNIP